MKKGFRQGSNRQMGKVCWLLLETGVGGEGLKRGGGIVSDRGNTVIIIQLERAPSPTS